MTPIESHIAAKTPEQQAAMVQFRKQQVGLL